MGEVEKQPVDDLGRLLTVAEAAQATGLTRNALDARIHRGSLPVERHGARVFIRIETLYEQGLLRVEPAATVSDLLDRLERQAERIGQQAETITRLELELRRGAPPER